ncbi:uncharacterized protein LOC132258481 [Phlebotomus argentipes]|uniref:uncharacterized protein LOC132258481 n=1 Tax=Phlebotomus argentipes TaxID=94469 RepID=UPI002892A7D9|nr:uncharacterized protein LOC132258481 [Phlebotomus argentipes]
MKLQLLMFLSFICVVSCEYGRNHLPRTSKPNHYYLYILVDPGKGFFNGSVTINLDVIEPTDRITLNYKDLILHTHQAGIDSHNFNYTLRDIIVNPDSEIVEFVFDDLPVGNYDFFVAFDGFINRKDLKGLYMTHYWTEDGKKHRAATTFLAPIYARWVFPCYDEPRYKAFFTVTLVHSPKYKALSNMPAISKPLVLGPNIVETTFPSTPRMSTYLLAFMVSDFKGNANMAGNFTVYSQPEQIHMTKYALEHGQRSLRKFEEYFEAPYQLAKMDMVAFDDFLMGAMENWGLITYLSYRLLYDEATVSNKAKQHVTKTITHELAHQWFGNEVTAEWWSEIWLNEGFATLYADLINDQLYPEWKIMDQFIVLNLQYSMDRDASPDTKSLDELIETLQDIWGVYNYLPYQKAASVIRMIQNAITDDIFSRAVKNYIKNMSYQTVKPQNLYDHLNAETNQIPGHIEVGRMFANWIQNPGFPLVTVMRDYNMSYLTVYQERFIASEDRESVPDTRYHVPINYATKRNPDFSDTTLQHIMFPDSDLVVPLNGGEEELDELDWVIVNKRATYYYRVNYDNQNWHLLSLALRENLTIIDTANRAQLIDDAFTLAYYGHLSYDIVLSLANYLRQETEFVPVAAAIKHLRSLELKLRGTNRKFLKFLLPIIAKLYNRVGMHENKDDSHLTKLLRSEVTRFACEMNIEKCLEDASKEDMRQQLNPNTRPAVLCAYFRSNVDKMWPLEILYNKMVQLTKTQGARRKNMFEFQDILQSFSCASGDYQRNSILEMTLKKGGGFNLFPSDLNEIFTFIVTSSESSVMQGLYFIASYYNNMEANYASMVTVFQTFGNHIRTDEELNLLKLIIKKNIDDNAAFDPDVKIAAKMAVMKAEQNIAWIKKYSPSINDWIKEHNAAPRYRIPSLILTVLAFIVACLHEVLDNRRDASESRGELSLKMVEKYFPILFGVISTLLISCRAGPVIISKDLSSDDDLQYKLPQTTRPNHYDLRMTIDVDAVEFRGWETIEIDVLQETDEIAINYKDMTVDESVSLTERNGNSIELLSFDYNNVTEILRLRFPPLSLGTYYLGLEFNGTIRNDRKGLYISTYFDNTGNKRSIATSFMAPNYARMAFPCYDEPEYKATYSIRITHDAKYFAISNMPPEKTEMTEDGWETTVFGKSLKTSTYIVTFIVCDFVVNKDPLTNFAVYSQPAVINDTEFALQYTQDVLKELEVYLDRTFQYPKMDIIAIDDFLMGAMENWGIITYLSSRILINDQTDAKTKHQVAKTIAHEVAHQWFGNEVTHFYWSAVWLKEGLASLFEDSISGVMFPEWRTEDKFTLDTMLAVMQDDAGKSGVRAMFIEVNTVEEIRNIYDFVTYKKAASVMRTMENIISSAVFQSAMRKYINDFSFNVATPDDLSKSWQWAVDQDTSGRSLPQIKEIFDTWITNPGFPVVTIARNYTSGQADVTQKRFMATLDSNAVPNTKYFIPLSYASPLKNADFKDTSAVAFLKHTDDSYQFPIQANNDDWVVFNVKSTMYYRVNYDERNWELISDALATNHNAIDPSNRAQLIDDAFNLARYGHLAYKIPLNLTKNYFKNERYYYTVASGLRNLARLKTSVRILETDKFSTLLLDTLNEMYNDVGIEESSVDDHLQKMLRTDITLMACKLSKSPCIEDSYKYLVDNQHNDISANVRRSIYCGAIQYSCQEQDGEDCKSDYPAFTILTNKLTRLTQSEASRRINQQEISDIIASFGCVKDSKLIEDILKMTIQGFPGVEFEKSYYNSILSAMLDIDSDTTKIVLAFLRDNFESIQSRSSELNAVFTTIGSVGITNEHRSLVVQMADNQKDNISADLKKSMGSAIDAIDENIAWNDKLSGDVRTWLDDSYPGSASIYTLNLLLILCLLSITRVLN